MKLWDSEGLCRLSLNWSRLYRESFLLPKYVICFEVIDYFSQDGLILLHGCVSFPAVFFCSVLICSSVFQVTLNFSDSLFISLRVELRQCPVHVCVCVGLCSFGHYIGINGLVVRLAIWNGSDSAALYELLISFPDPVYMVVHMTQTTALTYPIPEQIIYCFIYSVCWCSLLFDRWLLRVALRDLCFFSHSSSCKNDKWLHYSSSGHRWWRPV